MTTQSKSNPAEPASPMPRITLIFGILLVIVGIGGYIGSGAASWTALIPAILGALIAICAIIGFKRTKLGIHIALVIAIVGILGTIPMVLKIGSLLAGTAERPMAVVAGTITFVLLVAYVVIGVRSFISARRWKNANASTK